MLYQPYSKYASKGEIVTVGVIDKDSGFRMMIEKRFSENKRFRVILKQASLPVHYGDLPCELPDVLILHLDYFRWAVQLYGDPTVQDDKLPIILLFSEKSSEEFRRSGIFPCVWHCKREEFYAETLYFHVIQMVQFEEENGEFQHSFQYYILNDSFDLPARYIYAKDYLRRIFLQSAYSEHGQPISYLSNVVFLASSRLDTGLNMTELYEEVGEYYHVSGASVEKCIRTATGSAWKRYLEDPALYANSPIFCHFHRKPKNMELVYRCAMMVKSLLYIEAPIEKW